MGLLVKLAPLESASVELIHATRMGTLVKLALESLTLESAIVEEMYVLLVKYATLDFAVII